MTVVNPGPENNNTANVAGRLGVAWWDSQGTGLVGPQGQNIPIGAGGVVISAGANSQSSGTVNFSNANGVSFGLDNFGNLTATVTPGAAAGIAAVEAGTQTQTSGTLLFSNSNGFTFGMSNNSVITGSYTVPTQSVQTQASGAIAGTGFTSTTTGGVVVVGTNSTNGLSLGIPNYITTYVAQSTQTQPAGNIAGTGTTTTTQAGSTLGATQNSNGLSLAVPLWITTYVGQTTQTQPAGNIAGIGTTTTTQAGSTLGATLSTNGLSLAVPAWVTAGGGNVASIGVSTLGNTLGNTGIYSGQVVFAGGNNITLSVSSGAAGAQTITISGPNAGGAQTGISGIIVSNTTYTSGSVSLSNANGISFGSSAGQAITASYTVPATAGLISGLNLSGGAGNSQSNVSGLTFNNANGMTFGVSTGANVVTVTASYTVPSTAGLISGMQLSAGGGTSNTAVSGLTFANSNGFTFGLSTGANAGTITGSYTVPTVTQYFSNTATTFNGANISGSITINTAGLQLSLSGPAAGGVSTGGYYALGNTTQNSSTTLALSAQSFNALGAMTMGYSNGSIQVSAPATSSISGTGLVSVSVNGSTISIGAQLVQLSFYQPLGAIQNTTVTQNGLGSVQVYPAIAAFPFTATRADIMASVSASALALSTEAQTLSMYVGLYSLTGSTLSLASSGSQSYAWTNSSNNSNASITGIRRFSAPINVNYTGGFDLFVGVMTNTTFVNTNGVSLSNVVVPLGPGPQLQGLIGQTQVNSMQFVPGQGFFSVTSAAIPVSMALSAIVGAGSGGNAVDYYAPVQFVNITA